MVSAGVWDFLKPLIISIVKVEASGYIQLVLSTVIAAEQKYGPGAGQTKYDYTISELKSKLGNQFNQTPYRVWDVLIHAAVAKIS
jgi:hypothetical protein